MPCNFLSQATIDVSSLCYYDAVYGYASDFSNNGNVDGWNQLSGLHTYSCWNNFLFGTLIGNSGYIGRTDVFVPVLTDDFYTVEIVMKFQASERANKPLPTNCKLMWRTLADTSWSSNKSMESVIYPDNKWYKYVLNMSDQSYWVGDVNDLRFYPTIDGQAGDEFFIRSIKIVSTNTYKCLNPYCDYYSNYEHPCQGVGQRAFCKSDRHESEYFNIQNDSELIVNINGYGDETVKFKKMGNVSGQLVASKLSYEISKTGIGGYSEVIVVFDDNRFIIYSGTITNGSSVVVKDGDLSRQLAFFNENGSIYTNSNGETPASGFKPESSFHVSTFRLLDFFDNDVTTEIRFDPFNYAIEGGRSDLIESGLGFPTVVRGDTSGDLEVNIPLPNRINRLYQIINGAGRTLIDFTHPFNASGRIKKLFVICTLDNGFKEDTTMYKPWEAYPDGTEHGRIELQDAKVMIFRPKRDGTFETVFTADIINRDRSTGALYSEHQELIEIDCDFWVNKGDMIGIYNVNLYLGKTLGTTTIDAMYYSISGEASGCFDPGILLGEGSTGLMLYGRSEYQQSCLSVDIDFGTRTGISNIEIVGETESINLEYNIASCLDINWQVDLFNGDHNCMYYYSGVPWQEGWYYKTIQNQAYGINLLSDNVRYNVDGKAADSFTVSDAGGVIVLGPKYFFVNGDGEWLGIHHLVFHTESTGYSDHHVEEFEEDPITFDLFFPYNTTKTIYKSVIYFKETNNFRDFSLSTYKGRYDATGDAENNHYQYVPDYTAITLDGKRIEKEGPSYDSVKDYIFENPTISTPDRLHTGGPICLGYGFWNDFYKIINNDAYVQAANTDWQTITHEFDPVTCYGFRIYCNLHRSTKINEMEVYAVSREINTSLIGGVTVKYSFYGDAWFNVALSETDTGSVNVYIGDTPRYLTAKFEPITSSIFKDINVSVNTDSVYIGDKGCEYDLLLENNKTNTDNTASVVNIKNVYGNKRNLYVDIAKDDKKELGLIYHNIMNSAESISSPEVGPGGRYTKQDDYPLVNVNGNVAINSDCWGLKNLIDQKKVYYSYTNGMDWDILFNCQMVLDYNTQGVYDTSNVESPCVIKESDTSYKMWYTGDDGINKRIMYTVSTDGIVWLSHQLVINRNQEQTYDITHVAYPYVIKESDTFYKMWYSGYDGSNWRIMYAISANGITWSDYQMVVDITTTSDDFALNKSATASDYYHTYYPSNANDGNDDTYWMSYHSGWEWWQVDVGLTIVAKEMVIRIGDNVLAFELRGSNDSSMVTYTVLVAGEISHVDGDKTIGFEFEDNIQSFRYYRMHMNNTSSSRIKTFELYTSIKAVNVSYPCVIKESDTSYKMWYTAKDINGVWRIWYTDSVDGLAWNNKQIVINYNTEGVYDTTHTYTQSVIKESDTSYKIWYGGCTGSTWRILHAVSVDGVTWSDHQLLLDKDREGTYDTTGIRAPFVISTDDGYKMWYEGYDGSNWRIFYTPFENSLAVANKSLHFKNKLGYRTTVINLPKTIRNRYWKFSWDSDELSMKIYEACAYKDGKLMAVTMYENVGSSTMTDPAPYLQSGSITYDYFTMNVNNSLGIDLGTMDYIDSLVLIHQEVPEGSTTANDRYTRLDIRGIDGQIKDYSYYEYDILTTGSGISLGQGKFDIGTSYTTGVKFSGYDDSYMYIPSTPDLVLRENSFSIDFFVEFNTLPFPGEVVIIASEWAGDPPERSWNGVLMDEEDKDWIILIRNTGTSCHFEFWVNLETLSGYYYYSPRGLWADTITVVTGVHYHIGMDRRQEYGTGRRIQGYIDGALYGYIDYGTYYAHKFPGAKQNITIGKGLDGIVTEFRYSLSADNHHVQNYTSWGQKTMSATYWRQHQRLFKLNVDTSTDNVFYTKTHSVDLIFDTDYYDYIGGSEFNSLYDARLVIDLEKRYDLQILRSYGKPESFPLGLTHFNSSYSMDDVADPTVVNFGREIGPGEVDNSFVGSDYSEINSELWKVGNAGNDPQSKIYIKNNMLYMKNAEPSGGTIWIESKFIIKGFHNIQLDYILDQYSNSDSWYIWMYIIQEDTDVVIDDNNVFFVKRGYEANHHWCITHDGGAVYTSDILGGMRFCRSDIGSGTYSWPTTFLVTNDGYWSRLVANVHNLPGKEFKVRLYLQTGDSCPVTSAFLNLKVNQADGIFLGTEADYNDARWVHMRVSNNETLYAHKVGIYPDLTQQLSLTGGSYNCEWDFLGEAITNYSEGINVALNAIVNTSSYFSSMPPSNLTDGKLGSYFYDAWGSNQTGDPTIIIDLGKVCSIYRVKIYHGYVDEDDRFLVNDYMITYSLDNQGYTTIFNITGNTEFERTHDLVVPVNARYVKITITDFNFSTVALMETDGSLQTFEGAVIREIEINECYGYPVINSEEYPIIAVNMKDQFYINNHSLLGVDAEDTSMDWNNNETYFSYSDQIWENPSKITFSNWGNGFSFDQWVAVKRDTATEYNSGPDYLKHLVMSSNILPNPCNYPWWWSSNISTISRDFSHHVDYAISSLKIEYTVSSSWNSDNWLSDWAYRIELTINHIKIDENLTDFPLLIKLDSETNAESIFAELFSVAGSRKISITTSDGITQCYVEIEQWDWTEEQICLWVRVPIINTTENTTLYLYYDKTKDDNFSYVGNTGSNTAINVWDMWFVGVYHISQNPADGSGAIKDSTRFVNNGTSTGSMTFADLIDGKIGKAIDFDGSDDIININSVNGELSVATGTVTALIHLDSSETDRYIFDSNINFRTYLQYNDTGFNAIMGDPSTIITIVSEPLLSHWYQLSMSWEMDNIMKAYLGDSLIDTKSFTGDSSDATRSNIGGQSGTGTTINGRIDEVHISSITRSAAWIKATYHSNWDNLVAFSNETALTTFMAETTDTTPKLDQIAYNELEGFGIDSVAAWRDGLAFKFRIDNIDNIDLSQGYFYMGGFDATSEKNDVEYQWNLSTISGAGALSSGWNSLILPFKYADDVVYVNPVSTNEYDPRIPSNITFTSLGLLFKSTGPDLILHLDGFEIKRCHFNEYTAYNKGLYIAGDDNLTAPIGEFNPFCGTIEFWFRPDYDLVGKDFYNVIKTRSLFHFSNNSNDVFGAAITSNGLETYRGNANDDTVVSSIISSIGTDLTDMIIHLAFVYSNNGSKISSDSSTLRVYMNNQLMAKSFDTWDIKDSKYFHFTLGGNSPVGLRVNYILSCSSADAVISGFKIYNYCKTDFSGAINNQEEENVNALIKVNEFIEISKNNLTFHKTGDINLPLVFEEIDSESIIPIYVKSVIPEGLTGHEKRTPGLIISWEVAV